MKNPRQYGGGCRFSVGPGQQDRLFSGGG
jgi:hypothetical protein